jgi:hypothetical protein
LVTPDTVVLDLGAGIGILGLLAAAAGCKRIYLVEPEPVIRLAQELAQRNGIADRIVVLQGKIEDIELPEKVDLIVSVFTGNLLYSEDLLPSLFNARDRFLKPDGKLLPDQAQLLLAPWMSEIHHAENIQRWSEPTLGLDLAPARRFTANEIIWLEHDEVRGDAMSEGVVVAHADLMHDSEANCRGKAAARVSISGDCHGLMAWIRIKLGNDWLDTAPSSPALHWNNALLPLDPPLPLCAGEIIALTLQRPAFGEWTWSLSAAAGLRRHSTFLSRPVSLRDYRLLDANHQALLNSEGVAALHVLGLIDGMHTTAEIADSVLSAFPRQFRDYAAALRFVQIIVVRHCANGTG